MKVAPLLLLCLALPLRAETLQFSVIADNATHMAAWRVVQAATERLGVSAVKRELPAERAIVMANLGLTDGDVARTDNVERQYRDLVRVPEPLMHYPAHAYAFRQYQVPDGWRSLVAHRVCIRRGIKIHEERTEGMRREIVEDEKSMLRMLRSGACDIAMLERHNPEVLAEMAATPRLYRLQPPIEVAPLYIYLHKRHAALAPRLAEAVRELRATGQLRAISDD